MNEERFPKRKNPRLKGYDYSRGGYYFITVNLKLHSEDILCHITLNPPVRAGHPAGPSPDDGMYFDYLLENVSVSLTPAGEIVDELIKGIETAYENIHVDAYVIMPDHIHLILALDDQENGPAGCPARTEIVSSIINAFKSLSSRKIGHSIWHRSFYDRVIRTPDELNSLCQYIAQNPMRWLIKHVEGDTHA